MEHRLDPYADLIVSGAPNLKRGQTSVVNALSERLALVNGVPRSGYPTEPPYAAVRSDGPPAPPALPTRPARPARIELGSEVRVDEACATARACGSPGRTYAG